jgi:hypothetical protein
LSAYFVRCFPRRCFKKPGKSAHSKVNTTRRERRSVVRNTDLCSATNCCRLSPEGMVGSLARSHLLWKVCVKKGTKCAYCECAKEKLSRNGDQFTINKTTGTGFPEASLTLSSMSCFHLMTYKK